MFDRKIVKYLAEWKGRKDRKPLILRGARQVGKTSAVLIFSEKYFKDIVYVNLENPDHFKLFQDKISLRDFENIIKIKFHKKVVPGETLIFIDEIQNSPSLISLLRFFYEERPELHVIGAGSLLEAKIDREGFSVPVGRVEFAYLYPLDFFEYLQAKEEGDLLDFLRNVSINDTIPEGIHSIALRNFYEYTMIGGMPEIVKIYRESYDIDRLRGVYSSLFTSYCEDLYKYSNLADVKYLNYVIEKSPFFSGCIFKYEKFGGSNFRSREMSKTFNTLEKVMLLYQVQATKSTEQPLVPQRKRPKKLIFLDVGLANYQMNIQHEFLNLKDLNSFYRGNIAEQITGQNILSQFIETPPRIFYWAKDKKEGSAEVDFCISLRGRNLGIEVKSGSAGKLRSLYSFAKSVKNKYIIRIYGNSLYNKEIEYNGEKYNLVSIPFYLLPRILETGFLF